MTAEAEMVFVNSAYAFACQQLERFMLLRGPGKGFANLSFPVGLSQCYMCSVVIFGGTEELLSVLARPVA